MSKKSKKKSGKKKPKARKNPKRVAAAKKAYAKSRRAGKGLAGYNKKKNKKKSGGRKKGYSKKKGKKKGGKKGRSYAAKKHSILGYKDAAKSAAQRKAMHDRLVAEGKPPAVVQAIMSRFYRGKGAKKTKSKSSFFKNYRAQEAADRQAAYMAAEYARTAHRHNN